MSHLYAYFLYQVNIVLYRQARGDDGHNLVTVVMHQFQMDIQSAINWISQLHDKHAAEFLECWKDIPTFGGPVDREIRIYLDTVGNWIRAYDCWTFEVRCD